MKNTTIEHFVGLDVGTAHVRVIVGMLDGTENMTPTVIGHGVARNRGMRKGVVAHMDDVAEALMQALSDAERMSGVAIKHATVNVNGAHIQGMNSKGVVAISATAREINEDDRARVEEAATIISMPANREILQVFAREYKLDGQESVKDPIGLQGVRLEVDTHIVTASSPFVRVLDTALDKASITPEHHTISSLAAAEAVLGREQKESGVVVIDIGAGTTNIVVMEEGEVQHIAVLPIGGINITNDLAIGLKTEIDNAEKIKISHARLDGQTKSKVVLAGDDGAEFSGEDIAMIVEARVEELLEYVDKELMKIKKSKKLPGGAVIVGGSANIPGLAAFASKTLQLPARIGKVTSVKGVLDGISGPEFAAASGLMMLDMLLSGQSVGRSGQGSGGGMGIIGSSLKGLFKKARR